jgi:hypothetical protein
MRLLLLHLWCGDRSFFTSQFEVAKHASATASAFQEATAVIEIDAEQNSLRLGPEWVSASAGLGSWRTWAAWRVARLLSAVARSRA